MKIKLDTLDIKSCWECPFIIKGKEYDKYSSVYYNCRKGAFGDGGDSFGHPIHQRYKDEIHRDCPFRKKKK